MAEAKNTTTAKVIQSGKHVLGWTLFCSNLLALAVLLGGLLLWQMQAYAGGWTALRDLELTDFYFTLLDHPFELWLTMKAVGLETVCIDLTGSLLAAGAATVCFLVLQGLIRLVAGALWRGRIRHYLRQVDLLAEETKRLGENPPKVSDLQTAIDRLSPIQTERLHIADPDLEGLETAVNDLLDRMQEAYSQQSRFVSDASHELRTPIAVLRGYADLLERWGKDDPQVRDEAIGAIRAEAQRMSKLVEQLLFLARGDSGRTKLQPEPLDLSELVREVWEECRMIAPKHSWQLEAPRPVPVQGDRDMLRQALRVLTDNAVKYTPEGGTITLRAYLDASGCPTAAVRDQGIGIGEQDLPHVFDRFYRSDPARTRQHGGAGLGLSIAHWIVTSHGGRLEAYSWEGVGSRFRMVLPACTEEDKTGKQKPSRESKEK